MKSGSEYVKIMSWTKKQQIKLGISFFWGGGKMASLRFKKHYFLMVGVDCIVVFGQNKKSWVGN